MIYLRILYKAFLLLLFIFIFTITSVPVTFFIALPLLLIYIIPFDNYRRDVYFWIGSKALRQYIRISGFWKVTVCNKELLKDLPEPCIYVANHQSYFDIFVLYFLDKKFKWLSKRSLHFIPYFGMYLYFMRNIGISRTSPKGIKRAMDKCSFYLSKIKYSVFIFPEGTRLKKGQEPLRFRKGAFKLAMENKVPIVPIVINNIQNSISLKHMLTNKGRQHITIDVLNPVAHDRFETIEEYIVFVTKEMRKKLITK